MVGGMLDRKLLRNLRELRGQVITIALVVSCGIVAYVTMQSTWASLLHSRTTYYERYRFADVFATCKRAPEALRDDLEAIAGVATVYTRVVESALLPLEDLPEPATAVLVSIPAEGRPALNALHLHAGRFVEPGRPDEVVVYKTFADAHGVKPGDHLPAVINGNRRELLIVGTAASPEYVLAMAPGDIAPDPKRFAVLWLDRAVLAAAFQMDGAFNDVALSLQPGASPRAVAAEVDRVLLPYGSVGAVAREKQLSHFMLEGELAQLQGMATVVPVIFLGVAAFLLNVVLSRLVFLQRGEIAALKALGYSNGAIGLHFLKLVAAIVLLGTAFGVTVGAWLGRAMTIFYTEFFHFPIIEYHLGLPVVLVAVAVSLAAAVVGALGAVRRVTGLPPAEAMRPPPPARYQPSLIERWGLFALLDPAERMILREVQRRPWRLLLSSVGIAMACGILVVGQFWSDAVDYLIDVQFGTAMREDMNVRFSDPIPERALNELAHLPGVFRVEGLREVPVRFRSGARFRDSVLTGYETNADLRKVVDMMGVPAALPAEGLLLTKKLGEILQVGVGDTVRIEVREGDRPTREVTVSGLIEESFGLQGHADRNHLHALLGEEPVVTSALLAVDSARTAEIRARLTAMPRIVSVTRTDSLATGFSEQSGTMIVVFTVILTLCASAIAVGVVYNNARIALSMRSRELASLRVIGFTRAEISQILLGELALQVLIAIPIGLVVGTWLSFAMMQAVDPETYRFPVVISAKSYAVAVLVTVTAGLASALLVRRKLDTLDLIGVLKTRE